MCEGQFGGQSRMCAGDVRAGRARGTAFGGRAGCSDTSALCRAPLRARAAGPGRSARLGEPRGCGARSGAPPAAGGCGQSLFSGADATAQQLWPSDRKSGRWSLPSALIYGMVWPQAAALEMGRGGSKRLPLLAANNASGKPSRLCRAWMDASPGNPCLQAEDARPPSGRYFHLEARAAPVVPGLSRCSGPPHPLPRAVRALRSLLLCVARGCTWQGGARVWLKYSIC